MRSSFILYTSYEETLSNLSKEEVGELLMAIFSYQRTGEIPSLTGGAKIAFGFIKTQLDIDNEKWEKEVEHRSKAGKKGMEKRWGKKTDESITNDNSVISTITKITEYDNEDEFVNEYEKENEYAYENEKKRNPLLTFSEELNEKAEEWIEYKGYNPISSIKFINEIKEKLNTFSEEEIIRLIDLSISKKWKNIIWSRLTGYENKNMKSFYDKFSMR